MIYLASPYSHPDPSVRHARFEAACECAAEMMRANLLVYSPIAHSHPLAELGLPRDWAYWSAHSLAMLRACSSLAVLPLKGWQASQGVQAEIAASRELGLHVEVIDPAYVGPKAP